MNTTRPADLSDDRFEPVFNDDGLITAIVQDHISLEVLMLAWMNAEALEQTRRSGRATYWSRSRQEIWVKGLTSGNVQHVMDIRIDCDQDAVLLLVEQTGTGACHTGEATCFHRRVPAAGSYLVRDVGRLAHGES